MCVLAGKVKLYTRRLLHRHKERVLKERQLDETSAWRPSWKWRQHDKEMERMLKGVEWDQPNES